MKANSISLATAMYRLAARITARFLASSDFVESVLIHRTVATGEVSFGRSDIDLNLVVRQEHPQDGARLAALYKKTRMLQRANPVLGHIEVHNLLSFTDYYTTDTYWGSLERRGSYVLCGKPIVIPQRPVDPRDAAGFFGVWAEWFFSIAIQQRNRRNLRKTAIDIWNTYAAAEGLIAEPYPRRRDSEARLRALDPAVQMEQLEAPEPAAAFVFRLAEHLHRRFLPPLRTLTEPLFFEAVVPPRGRSRPFVILPRPDSPLPPQAFLPRTFVATPEALDLYLHFTNPLFYWALPIPLRDIGMNAPTAAEFLRVCRWFGNSRFLRHPGFLWPDVNMPAAITASVRHALDWLSRGEIPPPLHQEAAFVILAPTAQCLDYYRTRYAGLCQESQQLRQAAAALSKTAAIATSSDSSNRG